MGDEVGDSPLSVRENAEQLATTNTHAATDRRQGQLPNTHFSNFDHLLHRIRNQIGVKFQAGERKGAVGQSLRQPTVPTPPHPHLKGTYLRCRSMLAAESSMAVGLAMFLPTAWAKGWRAPCRKRSHGDGSFSTPLSPAAPNPNNPGCW